MTISKKNLSVLIVTFKSSKIIERCIQSIDSDIDVVIIDNSNDHILKKKIEKKYSNVRFYLSNKNLGMGAGNNFGFRFIKKKFVFVINPDVVLKKNTINELIKSSSLINNFSILSPIVKNKNYLNFKTFNKKNIFSFKKPFKVKSVDGFAMLLNLKKIKKILNIKNNNLFDENIFLYLENDDLCKNLIDKNENIYIIPTAIVDHLGGKSVNKEFSIEIELSRNWHWIWSRFYYTKKHYGFLFAVLKLFPTLISATLKYLLFSFYKNDYKKKIYQQRIGGFMAAFLGRTSYYRPLTKINDQENL